MRLKLPKFSAVETWCALNLFHIGAILAAIGGFGPRIPALIGLGVPANWVFQIGTVVGLCGALGAAISNPPLWAKLLFPHLYPVTPAMHEAALDRIVLPPNRSDNAKPSTVPTLPPPPPPRAA
jgi:hypothetical protein